MRSSLVAAAVLCCAALPASAQSDIVFKPGTWGIETSGDNSGALLRFTTPTRAWRLALSASYQHIEQEQSANPPLPSNSDTDDFANIEARVGIRGYRGTERFRPFTTFSLIAGVTAGDFHGFRAGASTEFGGAYFFSQHVSLGGFGEFTALYDDSESDGVNSTFKFRQTSLSFAGFRMLATVLF